MPFYKNRKILMNAVQYQEQIAAGKMENQALVELSRELGLDGVELRREVWPGYPRGLDEIRERARTLGQTVLLAVFTRLIGEADDRQIYRDIDGAIALGSPFLRVYLGPTMVENHPAWEKARQAVRYAESRGLPLVLENCSYMPGALLGEITNALRVLGCENLWVNLDIGNYYMNRQDVPAAIRELGPRIRYVHAKDFSFDPDTRASFLGSGDIPLDEIFDLLDALPQEIFYGLEHGPGRDARETLKKSMEFFARRESAGREGE